MPNVAHAIEYIDLGQLDPNNIKAAKWVKVPIKDQDFVNSSPRASALITQANPTEIIIFGGALN